MHQECVRPPFRCRLTRFNGRVQREVVGITIYSHQDLEILLAGFNLAYNGRRQRALKGLSPEMVLHQRLKDKPALARTAAKKADPAALDRTLKVVADAKEVSQPDKLTSQLSFCRARYRSDRYDGGSHHGETARLVGPTLGRLPTGGPRPGRPVWPSLGAGRHCAEALDS